MFMNLKNLRDIRTDRDLTQKDVAKALNVAANTYSQYENGVIPITAQTLDALADYFGTSVDYLLGRTDETMPYPKRTRLTL